MLQIVIWGIAIMLVVKGMDVLHQDSLVARNGSKSNPGLAVVIFLIALIGALGLVAIASDQASSTPTPPSYPSFGTP